MDRTVAIVGAGHAGGRTAEALRREGWTGPVVLIGEETSPPYERPPLSKALLRGEASAESTALRRREDYAELRIDLRLGRRVTQLDRSTRRLSLSDGEEVPYDQLILATGGRARRLPIPGADLAGILTLRDLDDAVAIAAELGPERSIVVVGGGFIGLEVAASARQLGSRVTVLEAAPRLVTRGVPAQIASRLEGLHREHGVDVRTGVAIVAFEGDGRVDRVTVVIGGGIAPNLELAEAAGLPVDNGIVVDDRLRTSDPLIFAVGDVASFPHPLFGRRIRLESWKNAEEQPCIAAVNIRGGNEPITAAPWFWSDQYDHTLQIAGVPDLGPRLAERAVADDTVIFFHLAENGRLWP